MSGSVKNQCFTQYTSSGVDNTATGNNQWAQSAPYSQDVLLNGTTLEQSSLSAPPSHNILQVPVTTYNGPSTSDVTTAINGVLNINGLRQQTPYNPLNYMNIRNQSGRIANDYATLNPIRPCNGQLRNRTYSYTQNNQIIAEPNWYPQSALGSLSQASNNNKAVGGVKKQKRIRTAFTTQQMMKLEQEYDKTRYLDRSRRIELAEILHLNERTIKIWFQNRRMKEKKDRAESLEDSEGTSAISESSTELANIRMSLDIHENCLTVVNEPHNQSGMYVAQYPVMATSTSANISSSSITINSEQYQQNINWLSQEQYYQYLQTHNQNQANPSCNSEDPQLSLNTPQKVEEVPTTCTVTNQNWDLSWLKTITSENEYE